MKKLLVLTIILMGSVAMAAGSADGGIPWGFIKLQIINFLVFGAAIAWLCVKKVAPALVNFKEDYIAKSNEAKTKLEQSKKERDDLQSKIRDLETNYDKELDKARDYAKNKYEDAIRKTKDSVVSLNKDLETQLETLKRSQQKEIKNLLLNGSVEELKQELQGKVDDALLMKLQESFVRGMEARV